MGRPTTATNATKWRTVAFAFCFIVAVRVELLGAAETEEDCAEDSEEVTECVTSIQELEGDIGIKSYTEAELNTLCSAVSTAFACLESIGCNESESAIVKMKYSGIKRGFNYLCTTGRQEYLNKSDCWESTHLRDRLRQCERVNREEKEKLGPSGPSTYATECRLDNDWVDCINDAVAGTCDEAASEVAKLFALRSLEPVSEVRVCQLAEDYDEDTDYNDNTDNDDYTSGASGVPLSVVLVSAILLLSLAL